MYTPKSLFISMLLLSLNQIIGMENPATLNTDEAPPFVTLPNELATIIIAQSENKDMLRQTCKHFSKLASKKTNKNILMHPQLRLTQEALNLFFLEYGAVGRTDILDNLLKKGANPNTCDDNKMTVMHYAAEGGDVEVIKLLLEYPEFITKDIANGEKSPCLLAVNNGHTDVINCFAEKDVIDISVLKEYLITAESKRAEVKKDDANVKKNEECGWPPQLLAALAGNFHEIKTFLEDGGNVNQKNYYGRTPLGLASGYGYFHIVALLLHKGAHVNAKQDNGVTPLHFACSNGHFQVVRLLLCKGANVNEKMNSGGTPLDLACLLSKEANVNEKTKDGATSLDLALSRGSKDIAELLKKHGGKTSTELKWGCVIQ